MNILFHTYGKLNPTKGGTERTTITVAKALTEKYGCRCFSSFEDSNDHTDKVSCIVDERCWSLDRRRDVSIDKCREILFSLKIDVVIVQGSFIHLPIFREAAKGLGCKIILAHHFEPGMDSEFVPFVELLKRRPKSLVHCLQLAKNILLYPLMRKQYERMMRKSYRIAYDSADAVVLLSAKFISRFKEFGQFSDDSKFRIIPNGLSFEDFASLSDMKSKKNQVLIVARLDERFKRLSLALDIWRRVKMDLRSEGWSLYIVGHGKDEHLYKSIVEKKAIPNIYFVGRTDPQPYYLMSSLFMMTSVSESWGLTLTEAQQMGVVPMAFDSYDSLWDIITHNQNGLIIPEGDVQKYVDELLSLMSDNARRLRIAEYAVSSSKRFCSEEIADLWWQLLSGI